MHLLLLHPPSPQANPRALHEIERADAVVYGMGSLYTSICPILCLEGMGEALAARGDVPKVGRQWAEGLKF